jgi:hypothetical protein
MVMADLVLTKLETGQRGASPGQIRFRDRLRALLRGFALDRDLAAGAEVERSPALALRARHLLSARTREDLGSNLRRIANRDRSAPSLVHVPIAGNAAAEAADLLGQVAARLLAPAPVDMRGVAQVSLLLSDGSGPLFDRRRTGELRSCLELALRDLEPRTA